MLASPELSHTNHPPISPAEQTTGPQGDIGSAALLPSSRERAYDAAADPFLRNDLETDVAIPMTAEDHAQFAPQTTEDFAQRWGQVQGRWQRIKAATVGAVAGRVRAFSRSESYDATKHNRVVQNEMYKSVGSIAVGAEIRSHLMQHDAKRFETYSSGKTTTGEKIRATVRDLAALGPVIGVAAIMGAGRLLGGKSEQGSVGAELAEGVENTGKRALDYLATNHTGKRAQERAKLVHTSIVDAQRAAAYKASRLHTVTGHR